MDKHIQETRRRVMRRSGMICLLLLAAATVLLGVCILMPPLAIDWVVILIVNGAGLYSLMGISGMILANQRQYPLPANHLPLAEGEKLAAALQVARQFGRDDVVFYRSDNVSSAHTTYYDGLPAVVFNSEWWEKSSVAQIEAVTAHEVAHVVLDHGRWTSVVRSLCFAPTVIAMVNCTLWMFVDSGIFAAAVTLIVAPLPFAVAFAFISLALERAHERDADELTALAGYGLSMCSALLSMLFLDNLADDWESAKQRSELKALVPGIDASNYQERLPAGQELAAICRRLIEGGRRDAYTLYSSHPGLKQRLRHALRDAPA